MELSTLSDWRLRSKAQEALLRLGAHPVRTATVFLVLATGFAALGASTLKGIADTRRDQAVSVEAGSRVVVFRPGDSSEDPGAESRGTLSAQACTFLATSPSVRLSGVVSAAGTIGIGPAGLITRPLFDVSSDTIKIWRGETVGPDAAGLVLGEAVATQLDLRAGRSLALSGGSTPVASVLTSAIRYQVAEGWVLAVSHDQDIAEECWVEFSEVPTDSTIRATAATLDPSSRPSSGRLVALPGVGSSPADLYNRSPVRWFWLATGLVFGGLLVLTMWQSRGNYALYRALGVRFLSILEIVIIETTLLLLVSAIGGAVWAGVLVASHTEFLRPTDYLFGAIDVASAALTAMLAVIVLASSLIRGTVADLLKGDT